VRSRHQMIATLLVSALATLGVGCGEEDKQERAGWELLVGSCYSNSILRFDADNGGYLGPFVSKRSGGLDCPEGTMAMGPDGDLYVTNFSPPRIRPLKEGARSRDTILRYDGETGEFRGAAVPPGILDGPHGLAFAPPSLARTPGDLLVSTRFTGDLVLFSPEKREVVRRLSPPRQVGLEAERGGLTDVTAVLRSPDGADLYVSDYSNGEIVRFDAETGERKGVLVKRGSGGLAHPHNMVFGPGGDLYVSNYPANDILRFDGVTGEFEATLVKPGSGAIGFPGGIAFIPDGDLVATRDPKDDVVAFDPETGEFKGVLVKAGAGGLKGATAVLVRRTPGK
jgi:hypothetical protein